MCKVRWVYSCISSFSRYTWPYVRNMRIILLPDFIWGIFHKQLNTRCELVLAAGRRTQIKLDVTWTHSRVKALGSWRSDDSPLCRSKMRQRRRKTSFERSRRCAAQKPYCRPSCRLHDGKGSEIPLTLLLSARWGKGRRDSAAQRHSTARGGKMAEKLRESDLNVSNPLIWARLPLRRRYHIDDAHKRH